MVNRCSRKNIPAYQKYGAKGTKCLWTSFEAFRDDMYQSYLQHVKEHGEKQTTIERIDVYGHYAKENCRWATYQEQSRNKRNSRTTIFRGKDVTVAEIAETLGQRYEAVYNRLGRGIDLEKPYRKKERLIPFQGENKTLRQWETILGIPRSVMYRRIFYKKWPVSRALSTPNGCKIRKNSRLLTIGKETKTLAQWAFDSGIKVGTLWFRLKSMTPEDAVSRKILTPSESALCGAKKKKEALTP